MATFENVKRPTRARLKPRDFIFVASIARNLLGLFFADPNYKLEKHNSWYTRMDSFE